MMGTQVKGLARAWGVLVFYGIIAVLFGIFAIFTPLAAAMSLVWALGLMALVEGIVSVVALFQRNAAVSRGWLLLYAIASVVFGILAISNPLEVAGVTGQGLQRANVTIDAQPGATITTYGARQDGIYGAVVDGTSVRLTIRLADAEYDEAERAAVNEQVLASWSWA